MQQLRFLFAMALHVAGDKLTHHQEYSAVYGHRSAGSLRLLLNLSVVKLFYRCGVVGNPCLVVLCRASC